MSRYPGGLAEEAIVMRVNPMSKRRSQPQRIEETVEEYIARGGVIKRIEEHPDPDDRVVLLARRSKSKSRSGSLTQKYTAQRSALYGANQMQVRSTKR
jgi:hypothetical protein